MNSFRQRLLYALVLLNIVPHFTNLPKWIPTIAILFVCWRWLGDLIRIPVPGRWGAAFLALLGTGAVYGEFGRLMGDEASTSLLILMVSLKVFEIRKYRDVMFVTVLCFLILMSLLLSEASVWASGFLFVDVALILSLMHYYHLPEHSTRWPIGRTVRLLFHSAPIFILLFVLFPRFNLGWFKPPQRQLAQTGFSGKLNPGSLSQLVQSQDQAFRAFFGDGDHPPINRMYWRGTILTEADGLNWDRADSIAYQRLTSNSRGSRVEMMLEPQGTQWVFTLDWPTGFELPANAGPVEVWERPGRSYQTKVPLTTLWQYSFRYIADPYAHTWDDQIDWQPYLKVDLPGDRTKSLLHEWRRYMGRPQLLLPVLREYYIQNKFTYSLTPPQVDSVEEFLFESRQGFCEHYASVTASLLRALRIPARVVVGYQGGAPSLLGDYTIVTQKDAHAWVEYWSSGKKSWLRVDPTYWIAPTRIDLGAVRFYENNLGPGLAGTDNALIRTLFGDRLLYWLARGSLLWDQAEVTWVTFLLRYDFSYQRKLLRDLGFKKISRFWLAVFSFAGVLVLILGAYGFFVFRSRARMDRLATLYFGLVNKMKKAGLQASPNLGPLAVEEAAVRRWPALEGEIKGIIRTLLNWRYGDEAFSSRDVSVLRQRIRHLNLKGS